MEHKSAEMWFEYHEEKFKKFLESGATCPIHYKELYHCYKEMVCAIEWEHSIGNAIAHVEEAHELSVKNKVKAKIEWC